MSSRKVLVTLCVLLASATAAGAYSSEVRKKCRADYFRLCSNHAVGSEQLRQCMETQRDNLSNGCIVALKEDGKVPRRLLHK